MCFCAVAALVRAEKVREKKSTAVSGPLKSRRLSIHKVLNSDNGGGGVEFQATSVGACPVINDDNKEVLVGKILSLIIYLITFLLIFF